jgi:hypothetical protein
MNANEEQRKNSLKCEISSSHGSEYDVQNCHQGWWWRQYVPQKRRSTIILHGSTSQKTILNFNSLKLRLSGIGRFECCQLSSVSPYVAVAIFRVAYSFRPGWSVIFNSSRENLRRGTTKTSYVTYKNVELKMVCWKIGIQMWDPCHYDSIIERLYLTLWSQSSSK